MSEDDKTVQAVVDEPKTPAEPGVEGTGARTDGDDLDKLLAEFDDGKPKPAPAAQPEPKAGEATDLKAVLDEVRGLRTERQQETFRKDMDAMVKNVRGDLNPEFFDDTLVESWIDAQARQDRRLLEVFANRHSNPKQFQKVVETLGRGFAKKYGKLPDKQATEDREAVTAAVRGASTKAPPEKAPDLSRLTPAEFEAEKERLFGG
jgi:hypothetical protein